MNMTIDNIRQMLDRYYDGIATPAETAMLKDFFRTAEDVPADMATDAAVFRAMAAVDDAEVTVPDNLKARIVAATIAARPRTFRWRTLVAVAASIALLLSLALSLLNFRPSVSYDSDVRYTREVTDPEEAAEEMMRVFAMLDRSFGDAQTGIGRADEALALINDPLNGRFNE